MINLFKNEKRFKITFLILAILSSFSFVQIVLMPNFFNYYLKKVILEENKYLINKIKKFKKSSCKKIYQKKEIEIDEKSIISLVCEMNLEE